MDPITATIVGGVLWFFLGSIGTVILYLIVFGVGFLVSMATDKEWPVAVSVPVAWLCGIAWEIFVIIQVIIQAVNLVQLLTK